MKVYLASGYRQRSFLNGFAEGLKAQGFIVCSRWLDVTERPDRDSENWEVFARRIAQENIEDLLQADVLIVDTNGIAPTNNGGVHFETGFMVAREKLVIVVGKSGNTFHWHPSIKRVSNFSQATEELWCLVASDMKRWFRC